MPLIGREGAPLPQNVKKVQACWLPAPAAGFLPTEKAVGKHISSIFSWLVAILRRKTVSEYEHPPHSAIAAAILTFERDGYFG